MDNDVMFNPLAYDEQVIAEKLGMNDYAPSRSSDLNTNLKIALLQEELAASKRRIQQMTRTKPTRETFVGGGCGCEGMETPATPAVTSESANPFSELLDNKKFLLFLVIVLLAVCVMQYFSHRSENKEILDAVYAAMRQQNPSLPTSSTTLVPPAPSAVVAQPVT